MNIQQNYFGDWLIRDEAEKIHIFRPEEMEIIGKAWYSYVQKRKRVNLKSEILINN